MGNGQGICYYFTQQGSNQGLWIIIGIAIAFLVFGLILTIMKDYFMKGEEASKGMVASAIQVLSALLFIAGLSMIALLMIGKTGLLNADCSITICNIQDPAKAFRLVVMLALGILLIIAVFIGAIIPVFTKGTKEGVTGAITSTSQGLLVALIVFGLVGLMALAMSYSPLGTWLGKLLQSSCGV